MSLSLQESVDELGCTCSFFARIVKVVLRSILILTQGVERARWEREKEKGRREGGGGWNKVVYRNTQGCGQHCYYLCNVWCSVVWCNAI